MWTVKSRQWQVTVPCSGYRRVLNTHRQDQHAFASVTCSPLVPAPPAFIPDHTRRSRLATAQHSSVDLPFCPCCRTMCRASKAQGPGWQITKLPLSCSHLWGPLILLSALQARSTDSLDGPGEGSVQPVPPSGGAGAKGKPGKR